MDLAKFLKKSKSSLPRKGTPGEETDWMSVCSFEVRKGSLWAGDPYMANAEDGFITKVPNGTYRLEAKAMDFAGRRVVSRVRVFLKDVSQPKIGKQIGDACTDSATLSVFDMQALDEAIKGLDEAFQDEVMEHDYGDCGIVQVRTGKGFQLPYVSTAFGDCSGPVYELLDGKRRVGFEIELLPPGYIFGEDEDD